MGQSVAGVVSVAGEAGVGSVVNPTAASVVNLYHQDSCIQRGVHLSHPV